MRQSESNWEKLFSFDVTISNNNTSANQLSFDWSNIYDYADLCIYCERVLCIVYCLCFHLCFCLFFKLGFWENPQITKKITYFFCWTYIRWLKPLPLPTLVSNMAGAGPSTSGVSTETMSEMDFLHSLVFLLKTIYKYTTNILIHFLYWLHILTKTLSKSGKV